MSDRQQGSEQRKQRYLIIFSIALMLVFCAVVAIQLFKLQKGWTKFQDCHDAIVQQRFNDEACERTPR
jgi:hypothetical protein